MKTFTRSLALLLLTIAPFVGSAQKAINNMDFENWTTGQFGTDAPVGFPGTYLGSSPSDPANNDSALTVTSEYEANIIQDTVGFAWNFGEGYTDRPDSVSGFFRWDNKAGDSAVVLLELTKYDALNDTTITIAQAFNLFPNPNYPSNSVSGWKEIGFPFQYFSMDTPDSLNIYLCSEGGSLFGIGSNRAGNVLGVDYLDLHFTSSVQERSQEEAELDLYPNPTQGRFQVEFAEEQTGRMEIRDMNGRVVRQTDLQGDRRVEMNMEDVEKGVYFAHILGSNGGTKAAKRFVLSE